jgi:hypothetical protein
MVTAQERERICGWYLRAYSKYRLADLVPMTATLIERMNKQRLRRYGFDKEESIAKAPKDVIREIEEWWGDGPADLRGTNVFDRFETLLKLAKELANKVL